MTAVEDTAAAARDVRDEDALNVERVDAWLRSNVAELPPGLPKLWQFPGGASNLTYLAQYGGAGTHRDIVLRTPPRGKKAASAHNMRREYDIQRALAPQFAAVPRVLVYADAQKSPVGVEIYAMDRAEGIILRSDMPHELATPQIGTRLGRTLFDLLADLHEVEPAAAGLDSLYRGPGYVRRQVEGWSRRFRDARTDDVPDGELVMEWLAERQPEDVGACVIHGDWRFDNLVLDRQTLIPVAVLDWELATIGDPLMDLGAALAYWVEPGDDAPFRAFRRQPSNAPGMPTREEIVARYLAETGRGEVDWTFYEVYGLFRLAVIAQQIWYRYRAGHTTNPAFEQFGPAVGYLLGRCERIIRS